MKKRKRKNDTQKRVVNFLMEHWSEKREFDTNTIKEELDLSPSQMAKAKYYLLKKKQIIDYGEGIIGLNKVPSTRSLMCSRLQNRRENPYCPIKKTFIEKKNVTHFCGQRQCVRFIDGEPEIYYRPNCEIYRGLIRVERKEEKEIKAVA